MYVWMYGLDIQIAVSFKKISLKVTEILLSLIFKKKNYLNLVASLLQAAVLFLKKKHTKFYGLIIKGVWGQAVVGIHIHPL